MNSIHVYSRYDKQPTCIIIVFIYQPTKFQLYILVLNRIHPIYVNMSLRHIVDITLASKIKGYNCHRPRKVQSVKQTLGYIMVVTCSQ